MRPRAKTTLVANLSFSWLPGNYRIGGRYVGRCIHGLLYLLLLATQALAHPAHETNAEMV